MIATIASLPLAISTASFFVLASPSKLESSGGFQPMSPGTFTENATYLPFAPPEPFTLADRSQNQQ